MTAIVTIGIDLAKNVFAIHDVDATGKPAPVLHSTRLLDSLHERIRTLHYSLGVGRWSRRRGQPAGYIGHFAINSKH